jgi:hypothetical protein
MKEKRMHYQIPKGTTIWLKEGLSRFREKSPTDKPGFEFETERDMGFNSDDVHDFRHSTYDDAGDFYIFCLPENERGYEGFSVYARDVKVIEK